MAGEVLYLGAGPDGRGSEEMARVSLAALCPPLTVEEEHARLVYDPESR